jgi:hypothetical protein
MYGHGMLEYQKKFLAVVSILQIKRVEEGGVKDSGLQTCTFSLTDIRFFHRKRDSDSWKDYGKS